MCHARLEQAVAVLPTAPRVTIALTDAANPVARRETRVVNEHLRAGPPARDASTDDVHRAADRVSPVVMGRAARKGSSAAMACASVQGAGRITIAPGTGITDVRMGCAFPAAGARSPVVLTAGATT